MSRVLRKVRRALRDGTLWMKMRRRVSNAVTEPIAAVRGARQRRHLWDGGLDGGALDHRGTALEQTVTDDGLGRLMRAYQQADADWSRSPEQLLIRGVWAEWLDLNYSDLRRILRGGEAAELRAFLENMHHSVSLTGLGATYDEYERVARPLRRAHYVSTWTQHRAWLEVERPDWSDVQSSTAGNPVGVLIGDRLVMVETMRHAHHATWLLAESRPRQVLEIGGGLAGQAIQFLNLTDSIEQYTIIDIPEVSVLSGFVLMATYGEAAVRLYSEDRAGQRLEVMPPWHIDEIADGSVDLVFNSYSFSEMDSVTSSYYLTEIERVCASRFFHVNHELRFRYAQGDGSVSVNRVGSEMVPDEKLFNLAWRRDRVFSRPESSGVEAYAYLYERVN